MGVLKGSLIHINNDIKVKIEDLKVKDDILSLKKKNGLLNYKYSGKSITLNHEDNDFEYSKSHIHYKWNSKIDRYYIINDKLKITLDHIICVQRDEKYTWDYVKSLEIGDKLLKKDLLFEEIIKIDEIIDEKVEIHSINLDGYYNYFCDDYLLHNAGVCDQDLSYSNNVGEGSTVDFEQFNLPNGSCAYCGIDDTYFWLGPNRYDTTDKIALPPPKYLINSFTGNSNTIPMGLLASSLTFTYRTMPKYWYDRSQLRIPNRQLNRYYHVYLHVDGQWKFTEGTNQNDNMPNPTDIYPHNLKPLFDNNSWGTTATTRRSRFDSYHSYISGGPRVLLDNSTDTNDWIPYGYSSQNNLFHNSQTGQTPLQRYAENTLDASGKGGNVDHWEKVRFCFTVYKTLGNYHRTIPDCSFDGINTFNYVQSAARWRFINIKGGFPGNPNPFSSNPTTGGYNDPGDDYQWGANFFVIALDTYNP